MIKLARVATELQPHQQRVVRRIKEQPGLVVAHGMGSGKTLTSIAAADELGGTANVIVPAALQGNYKKEIAKHAPEPNAKFEIQSLQRIARSRELPEADINIIDEAHRLREAGGAAQQTIAKAKSKKRLLLTGTPFYNHPHDISSLVNIAAGDKIMPGTRADFEKQYVQNVAEKPGFIARHLRGIAPGEVKALKNTEQLKGILDKWVDYHENTAEGFPTRNDVTVNTPLSETQLKHYKHVMGDAPAWLRYKVKKGLPPTKQEAQDLNAFLSGVRQVSISPGGYDTALSPEQAAGQSSKIQEAANRLQERLKKNPQHRAVVYSNFLESGINPYAAELKRRGIAHGQFTGAQTKEERDAQVRAYNEGKLPVLMLSSAGGEGLDLKGTRQIQLLDPHFNKEKLEQVIARGIRYKSHEALDPTQRNVDVEHYVGTMPAPTGLRKMLGKKQEKGVDEYLRQLSADKDRLNEQMRGLLRPKAAQPDWVLSFAREIRKDLQGAPCR
jgi:SNF2 family DNA or RNA helicase